MLEAAFSVGSDKIAAGGQPYIIAEIGSNHNQSIDNAYKMIDIVAEAGAHAAKFQLFKAEKMYPIGTKMYDIFKSIELDINWIVHLEKYCSKLNIQFMASPFDKESASLLENIGVNAYKIASSEIVKGGLLSHIASFNKPMFISTGMSDIIDVQNAIDFCTKAGNKKIALLQCGAMYPIPVDKVNLKVMDTLSAIYGCPIGFSDHTRGMTAAVAAVGRGACVIEKHITLDRNSDGPDHFFAMESDEFKTFTQMINDAYKCLGSPEKKMLPEERLQGRREGLYAARDIEQGEVIRESDILIQRPAGVIRKRYIEIIIGAVAMKAYKCGDALDWTGLFLSE